MTFGKTALRCWLPAAALLLALLCPLPVAAARAGTAIPVSVRTDGAAADAVYTVELTHGNFLHLRRLLPCFQQIPDLLQQHLLCILSDLLYWYSFLSEYVRLR